jgi:predicted XRE-type DNA-binding protein
MAARSKLRSALPTMSATTFCPSAKIIMTKVNQREQSSGKVFADLDIPEPSLYLAKAQLANQISVVIRERNLTQVEVAEILGINQPKVSALTRGNLDGFSSDRLFKFLNLLGQDIEIVIRPHTDLNQEAGIKIS